MKKLLPIILLSLFFITSSQSDDIREFQLEEISIGDSLLNYYNVTQINKARETNFKDNKYIGKKFLKTEEFEEMQFMYLTDDKTKIIHGISAIKDFDNNLEKCKEERDLTVDSLKGLFMNAKLLGPVTKKHGSGKSMWEGYGFELKSGDLAIVACYYSKKNKKYAEHLRISLRTNDYNEWLINTAYK